jgi:hypothetical protein
MKCHPSAAAIFACLFSCVSARGGVTVADFEDIPLTGPQTVISDFTGSDFVSRGIIFDGVTGTDAWTIHGPGSPHDTGHNAADPVVIGNGTGVVIRRPGSRPFDFLSVRLSARVAGDAPIVRFTGFKVGGGTISSIQTGSSTLAGTVLTLPSTFVQLSSVQITRESPYHRYQIDDVTVFEHPVLRLRGGGVYNEAHGTVKLSMEVEHPPATPLVLTYTLGGTATAGTDYTAPGGGTLTIPANQTQATLEFPLINDTAIEPAETLVFTVSGGLPAGAVFDGASSATITIGDNDGVTTFSGWMTAHGLASTQALAEADPNGDGISNVESWLFRLNPAGVNPAAWLSRRAQLTGVGGGDPGLRLVLPNPLPTDVRIVFEESTALSVWSEQARRNGFALGSSWSGPAAARVIEANSLVDRTVTLRASVSGGPRPALFLRAKYDLIGGSEVE